MGHTAGRDHFGQEWVGALSVKLYVEQTIRKLHVFYNTLYRRIGWATCYPEALSSFFFPSVHPGKIIKRFLE